MKYQNILVTVDGSKVSEYAFHKAVEVAKRNDATLHIAHVIDIRTYASANPESGSIHEQAVTYTETFLKGYQAMAEAEGVKAELIYESGSAKQLIPKTIAKRVNADLIVCGSTGYNMVERFVLGSVSEAIVRYALCDVLVIKTENMPNSFEKSDVTKTFTENLINE